MRVPSTVLILAGAAVFYCWIYPAPYSQQIYRDMPVYALDRDDSPLSRMLLARIDATEELAIIDGSGNRYAAIAALKRGEVLGYIEIDEGFQREVTRGQSPAVGLFANAGYLLAYSQLTGSASSAILSTGQEIGVGLAAEISGGTHSARISQIPFSLAKKELYDPAGGYASFVVPAVAMIILQQTMLIGLGLLCDARRKIACSLPRGFFGRAAWTLGRASPWVVLYLLQFLIIRWLIFPDYHLPSLGHFTQLLLFMGLFFLTIAIFGLLVAEVFASSEDVIPFLLFSSLPIVFLSGFSWPLEDIPLPLQWLSGLLPSTAAVEGFVRLNQLGSGLPGAAWPMAHLALLALLYAVPLYFVTLKRYAHRTSA
ncbi:ABC transporter permease [Microbulbifer aestuariivivens]